MEIGDNHRIPFFLLGNYAILIMSSKLPENWRASHPSYFKTSFIQELDNSIISDIMNKGMAMAYQVKQVLSAIDKLEVKNEP
jgi:hypothetical protein